METRLPSVIAVANVFIDEARRTENTLTLLQLIKLAYIAYGFYLGFGHGRLFREEIQVWKYGPVIPDLYRAVRHHGRNPITQQIATDEPPLDAAKAQFVRNVYASYGKFSGVQLTNLTHQKGTPWDLVYSPKNHSMIISDKLIKDYYQRFIEKHSEKQ